MSAPINTGGPAFPTLEEHGFDNGMTGMTLRDYFAAKAMAQLIAIYEPSEKEGTVPDCAESAYFYADAMLEAREA